MISMLEFKTDVMEGIKDYPSYWRKGQKVFNYVDENYGEVARKAQFIDGIDCFYNDEKISDFLNACYEHLVV